jgi:hypothetical protein
MREGSGVTVCPMAPDPPPAWEGFGVATCPVVLDQHPARDGSGVATCHMALDVLWVTCKREILSRPTYSVEPTCL